MREIIKSSTPAHLSSHRSFKLSGLHQGEPWLTELIIAPKEFDVSSRYLRDYTGGGLRERERENRVFVKKRLTARDSPSGGLQRIYRGDVRNGSHGVKFRFPARARRIVSCDRRLVRGGGTASPAEPTVKRFFSRDNLSPVFLILRSVDVSRRSLFFPSERLSWSLLRRLD